MLCLSGLIHEFILILTFVSVGKEGKVLSPNGFLLQATKFFVDMSVTLLQSFLIQNDMIFLSQLRNVIRLKFLGHREGTQLTGKEYSNNPINPKSDQTGP